ncbi:MAG: hypothetical protein AVDCRST_MAG19-1750, partial [uncultured Thermomicrobiales bacterium]
GTLRGRPPRPRQRAPERGADGERGILGRRAGRRRRRSRHLHGGGDSWRFAYALAPAVPPAADLRL